MSGLIDNKAPFSGGGSSPVVSVFGRIGAVVAEAGDYSAFYATVAQGALADTAVQPGDLAAVAFSGDYGDLINTPSLNFQPLDATLTALANLSGTADTFAYFTGAEPMALTPLTPFARTILDDADGPTVLATLEAAGLEVANVFTADQLISGKSLSITTPTATAAPLYLTTTDDDATNGLVEMYNSSDALLTSFDAIGNLRLGFSSSDGAIGIGLNAPLPDQYGIRIDKLQATGGTSAAVKGEWGSSNNNDTYGLDYVARAHHTSGTMSNLVGVRGGARKSNTANVTSAIALQARAPTLASTGVIASNYGVKVESQNGTNITTAYALHTSIGLVVFNETGDPTSDVRMEGDTDVNLFFADASADRVGIGEAIPTGKLHVEQASTTAAIPTLWLRQADLSEEFIRFETTVGAGNPVDTAALGAYYGKVRVYIEGVGAKWLALYN